MKRFLQTRYVFLTILGIGLFVMAARSVTDPDVWWHLRTGELIVETYRIPHSDPYSFTKFGQPWLDHEWLCQVLLYATYRLAGWGGLIVEFAAIIAAAFAIVFLRSPGRPYIAGAVTVWGAVASIPSWGVRPQMITLLFASIFLLIAERSQRHPRLLWWTPPLMLLWANLHAGYALGVALLLLYLAGAALDRLFGQSEIPNPKTWFTQLAIAILACVAVVPLNPYGIRLYSYPLATLHSRAMLAFIGEWLSPDFHQGRYLAVLLMIFAALVLPALSPRKLRLSELLLLSVTLYAALRSVRHIPIFVLVAVPLISSMAQAWLEASGKSMASSDSLSRVKMLINALFLVAVLTLGGLRLRYVIGQQKEAEARAFPAAATSFLATHRPPGPLLNYYDWGGYLIWRLYPEYQVYIDGRADVYGDTFMNEFVTTYYLRGQGWQQSLEKWPIRTVVLPADSPLVTALQSMAGWKSVFADSQAAVLTR